MAHIMNRAGWIVAGVLALLVVAALTGVVHGGPLDPPASVPAPTMKTLQQVEPRTPIESLPFTISTSGSYYLTGNLTGSVGPNGITISVDNVTLDLRGFALIGPGGTGSELGVFASGYNTTIRNGTVRDWAGAGVLLNGTATINVNNRVEDLKVHHNGFSPTNSANWGIVANGAGTVITGCTASSNGNGGLTGGGIQILGGEVTGCASINNLGYGIRAQNATVTDCTANGNVIGINAIQSLINNCTANLNTADGISVGPYADIEGNHANFNGSAGIHATSVSSRLEDNDSSVNGAGGIKVDVAGNAIVKNSASANAGPGNYSIVAGNTVGAIGAVGTPPTDPWGNLQY